MEPKHPATIFFQHGTIESIGLKILVGKIVERRAWNIIKASDVLGVFFPFFILNSQLANNT
jgi:hypothetical protein